MNSPTIWSPRSTNLYSRLSRKCWKITKTSWVWAITSERRNSKAHQCRLWFPLTKMSLLIETLRSLISQISRAKRYTRRNKQSLIIRSWKRSSSLVKEPLTMWYGTKIMRTDLKTKTVMMWSAWPTVLWDFINDLIYTSDNHYTSNKSVMILNDWLSILSNFISFIRWFRSFDI